MKSKSPMGVMNAFGRLLPHLSSALICLLSIGVVRAQSGSARWTNSLGMAFVSVPQTEVKFCIWETRVCDYSNFVAEGQWAGQWPLSPKFQQTPTHPVVNVSWDEAKEFCIWLTRREQQKGLISTNQIYRLPTDREWSSAAGLANEKGQTAEKRIRISPPSSNPDMKASAGLNTPAYIPEAGNYAGRKDGFEFTSPVGSFAPNNSGLFDLHGNVWEWCMDYADDGRRHVLRGGSWANPPMPPRVRDFTLPDNQADNYGFRCVLSPKGSRL